jgi:hypothetical protein
MNNLGKLQIAVLYGVLLTVTACSSVSKNGENTPSSSSTTTAPIFTASNDPRADVVNAMRKNLEAKSYRMRSVTTSTSGYNSSMTTEFVAPDRMHAVTETNMPGQAAARREIIYIGKVSYVKTGDALWQKDDMGMGDLIAQMRADPKLIDELTNKAEVKYLGADTLDGAPMLMYQYILKSPGDKSKDIVSKVWIGATDNLQHQIETEGDFADPLTTGKMIHSKTTITFYDYNTDIKIESPM